jgi:UDP-N-acetylmuramyl pentapeptide synthase
MRKIIAKILKWQAQKFMNRYKPSVVAVAGSVGKTSTTHAIATVLSESFTVRSTLANYNTDIGIPLSIFAVKLPQSIKNPISWIYVLLKTHIKIYIKPDFEYLVLELGTDAPGDIESYSWLMPDVAVITAIAQEHMEFFKTIERVAEEELTVASYSDKTLINKNMVDSKFLASAKSDQIFNYSRDDLAHLGIHKSELSVVGEHSIDAVAAGIAVGKVLGMQNSELIRAAKKVEPLPGRMQVLKGIKDSTLIDDTYNASPEAVIAALKYIYSVNTKQRIALLGNMNELGEVSNEAHTKIGDFCAPDKLDLVITLGVEANHYTADAAKSRGCAVAEAQSPYEAAEIIKRQLKEGAVVLFKGSQNGVFAEEAVKMLLKNPEDTKKLVRQSKFWQKKKKYLHEDTR